MSGEAARLSTSAQRGYHFPQMDENKKLEAAFMWAAANHRLEFELTEPDGSEWDEGRDLRAALEQAERALDAVRAAWGIPS